MIFFDVTKSAKVRHRSGLARLSHRLRKELGPTATASAWTEVQRHAQKQDWFISTELFSESERPGFLSFLRSKKCRTAAVFADAIPLKHPHITWPQSVARHPSYLKMLAEFDRVWAISNASREELLGYWDWIGLRDTPTVDSLPLGADFDGSPRVTQRGVRAMGSRPRLLCVGILEPRKNQLFLLDVCEALWRDGLRFELHIVGRVNPHFGEPIVARIKWLRRRFSGLHYHEAAGDDVLADLYSTAAATVCPTLAEGCGLPLLESLWRGVPCVCSDLPVLRENADGGGCFPLAAGNRGEWIDGLRRVVTDDSLHSRLSQEATSRALPTWSTTAEILRRRLV